MIPLSRAKVTVPARAGRMAKSKRSAITPIYMPVLLTAPLNLSLSCAICSVSGFPSIFRSSKYLKSMYRPPRIGRPGTLTQPFWRSVFTPFCISAGPKLVLVFNLLARGARSVRLRHRRSQWSAQRFRGMYERWPLRGGSPLRPRRQRC
jgi:hypothetical protein